MSAELPPTAVPMGIEDPVERARAELKAALSAIEEKANVPRRVSQATERGAVRARLFADRNPIAAIAAVAGVAVATGFLVWGAVRLMTR